MIGLYKRVKDLIQRKSFMEAIDFIKNKSTKEVLEDSIQRESCEVISTIAQLDRKLNELDEAANVSDDALRKEFDTFRMDYLKDIPKDPLSDEYKEKQFELYKLISNKKYEVNNEIYDFNIELHTKRPFPYTTGSCKTVGEHLMAIGFIIKTMDIEQGSRVLEFGPGWGNITEAIARMGNSVTAVDISQNFCNLISERARILSIDIKVVCGDFSFIEEVDEPYDAVLFFESFHHCADHMRLIKALSSAVKDTGKIVFAGEPIYDEFPLPWGLRMDGQSLWAIRKHGWFELGFQESYFRKAMAKHGWALTKHVLPNNQGGNIFVAQQ